MALNAVPWDQNPEFLAACITQIPPGGTTAYADTEPMGNSPSDMTGFIWGQQAWSETNLPDILYTLEPSPEWNAYVGSARPPHKIGTDGGPLFEQYPTPDKHGVVRARKLLDFKILPDRVSTKVPWWKLEAWRRLDPRVRWCDILMRMELGGRPTRNALNTECFRWRRKFTMISWHDTPTPGAASIKAEVLRSLTAAQRATNSTRGSTPGLIDPSVGEQGGRVPLPNPPRPVRRSGVPTAIGNNANGQNNPSVLATGPPQAGNLGFGYHPTALATGTGTAQAGNLGFGHSNGPGINHTNHRSLMLPPSVTFGAVLSSSAMLDPRGPTNSYSFQPQIPSASNYHQSHHSSLGDYSQHDISIGSGQRSAVNAFQEDSASARNTVGGVTSSSRTPSMNQSVFDAPTVSQPYNGGNSYAQGRQSENPSYPILPGVPKRSRDSVEPGLQDARTIKRSRVSQNSANPVLETPGSTASRLRTEPEVRHNSPTAQFHRDYTSQTLTPELRRHIQQYRPSSTIYHGSPKQALSRRRNHEPWSELSGFSGSWYPTTKKNSDARAYRSSTYLPLPMGGRGTLQEQQGPNATAGPRFSDILNSTDPSHTIGLGLSLNEPRCISNTWRSERGSRADFGRARNSTSHRMDSTENDQEPAMHHPTDRAIWSSDIDAWLAADGGWDEFPMSASSRPSALGQQSTGVSIQLEGVSNITSRHMSLSTSAPTQASDVAQREKSHSPTDTGFTVSSTQNKFSRRSIGDSSLHSHQTQHSSSNMDGLDYVFDDLDEDGI